MSQQKQDKESGILKEKTTESGIILPPSVLKDQDKYRDDMSVVNTEKKRVKDAIEDELSA